ncbi:unnamed protein product [Meganyctiphanes norvegica]|uniref:Uncharacterized protein n=1 Tax=Meganyctiphanes norvegica TaxID=48144 RepID=A0AAV2RW71_MEGNR
MPQQYTTGDQVRYLCEWFSSWSEMQREDFIPILAQAYFPKDHINGLLGGISDLSVGSRRPSLFDCQVKLFHDWFVNWTDAERTRLLEYLRETDPEFMAQYEKKVSGEIESVRDTPSIEPSEEGINPPSSMSSPPSTLPRSHSPHDSGLDEPEPSDSDHTEPHSLDSCHDSTAEEQRPTLNVSVPEANINSSLNLQENSTNIQPSQDATTTHHSQDKSHSSLGSESHSSESSSTDQQL